MNVDCISNTNSSTFREIILCCLYCTTRSTNWLSITNQPVGLNLGRRLSLQTRLSWECQVELLRFYITKWIFWRRILTIIVPTLRYLIWKLLKGQIILKIYSWVLKECRPLRSSWILHKIGGMLDTPISQNCSLSEVFNRWEEFQ